MDAAKKAQWIAALRSGDFKQGHSCLQTSRQTFCCLGVACEIAAKENIVEFVVNDYGSGYRQYSNNNDALINSTLPDPVSAWLGLFDMNPSVVVKDLPADLYEKVRKTGWSTSTISLVELNDSIMFNFNQIADVIEACL